MIYLIWGLLNLGLVIYFLVICFKATKLVREKIGLFAAVFFVLGFLSFLGKPARESYSQKSNLNKTNTWYFTSEDSLNRNATYFINIEIEKNWISEKHLGINYGKDIQGLINIPISAYSATTGFVSGTVWRPISIKVNRTGDNNKFQYFIVGVVDWKLLGATIYTQSKEFAGDVITNG